MGIIHEASDLKYYEQKKNTDYFIPYHNLYPDYIWWFNKIYGIGTRSEAKKPPVNISKDMNLSRQPIGETLDLGQMSRKKNVKINNMQYFLGPSDHYHSIYLLGLSLQ